MCVANIITPSLWTRQKRTQNKKLSEGYPCSNSNEQEGTVSHDEMNLQKEHREKYNNVLLWRRGKKKLGTFTLEFRKMKVKIIRLNINTLSCIQESDQ